MSEQKAVDTKQQQKKPRGLAALTPERRREIAAIGGRAAHAQGKARQWTREEAAAAGKLGGDKVSADPEHMREIGRLGGAASRGKLRRAKEQQCKVVDQPVPLDLISMSDVCDSEHAD